MKLHWIKYVIVGIFLAGIIIFLLIAAHNMIVYNTPVFGFNQPSLQPELNAVSRPIQFADIASNDTVRDTLITEDQAWASAWTFLRDRVGFTVFLPMEKKSIGLRQVTDDKGDQYLAWEFSAKQYERPYLIFQRRTMGGEIFIDAHDAHVLWYAGFS